MCVFWLTFSELRLTIVRQILTKDEGGRYTPFMVNYRPQVFMRTADITTALEWPAGTPDAEGKMVCFQLAHSNANSYKSAGNAR